MLVHGCEMVLNCMRISVIFRFIWASKKGRSYMKKIWPLLFASIAAMLFVFFTQTTTSQARDVTEVVGLDVNSAVIRDARGKVLSHDAVLPENKAYTVTYNWKIPNGVKVKAGDTFTFTVPNNVTVPADDSFPLKNFWGTTIGNTFIAKDSHVGAFTVNDYFTKNTVNRHGTMILDVKGSKPTGPVTPPTTPPTTPPGTGLSELTVAKTAKWVDEKNPTEIDWTVSMIDSTSTLVNPSFKDTLSKNHTYVEGSAKLVDTKGFEIPVVVTTSGNVVNFKAEGGYFGNLTLTYQTKTNEKSGADTFSNMVEYSDDNDHTGSAEASISRPEPPVEPTEPPVEPTEPPVEPTEPPVEPTEPPVEPTEPPVEPTEPPVEPTEPPVEPTEPPVEPTEPPVEPTEPPVEPTEPPVEPGKPDPGKPEPPVEPGKPDPGKPEPPVEPGKPDPGKPEPPVEPGKPDPDKPEPPVEPGKPDPGKPEPPVEPGKPDPDKPQPPVNPTEPSLPELPDIQADEGDNEIDVSTNTSNGIKPDTSITPSPSSPSNPSKPSNPSNSSTNSNDSESSLPQTGEQKSSSLLVSGLLLMMLIGSVTIKRRKIK